jgi:hypothetical protein
MYPESKRLRQDIGSVLTEEQLNMGFFLEIEEDFIYLYDKEGTRQGIFSSQGATIKAIREEIDKMTTTGVNY